MVEIKEDFKESGRQEKIKEFKGLVKKVFGFPFYVNNIGNSFYVYSCVFSSMVVRAEGDSWIMNDSFDYGIYVNREKYVNKAKELAELIESTYEDKKACVIKELPFK